MHDSHLALRCCARLEHTESSTALLALVFFPWTTLELELELLLFVIENLDDVIHYHCHCLSSEVWHCHIILQVTYFGASMAGDGDVMPQGLIAANLASPTFCVTLDLVQCGMVHSVPQWS